MVEYKPVGFRQEVLVSLPEILTQVILEESQRFKTL